MIWGFISHEIHFPGEKSHVRKWSAINLIAIALAVAVVAYPFMIKTYLLMVLAILRSIIDYLFCWDFYFPGQKPGK
jgi:hypothetical protein